MFGTAVIRDPGTKCVRTDYLTYFCGNSGGFLEKADTCRN